MFDWTPFAPPAEEQHSSRADSMGCVSFSAIHCIESQEIRRYGYTLNYSERALATLSGTTPSGNDVLKVVNAINQYGLILDKDWPTNGSSDWTWAEFYTPIPPSVLAKAIKVKVNLVASVDSSIAPLWTEVQLLTNGKLHMVEGLNEETFFDSYDKYIKPYNPGYKILWQSLLVLEGNPLMENQAKIVKSKTGPTVYWCYPMPDMDYLQKKANLEGVVLPDVIPDTDTL